MKLNDFPTELLSEILGHLQDNCYALGKARLVCRQWNALARRHMYQTVSLQHYIAKNELFDDQDQELAIPDHHGFRLWTAMAQNEVVRQTAKVVKIYSGPPNSSRHLSSSKGFWEIWHGWEHGEWEEFQDAIARVADFPALNHVHILFPPGCTGLESSHDDIDEHPHLSDLWIDQGLATRHSTLCAVFEAIAKHNARHLGNANANGIRALSITNLANHPFPELLLPGYPFDSFIRDITQLRLHITHEDHDCQEDEMDLIERQTSLEKLVLDKCVIVTYLHLGDEQIERWGVSTDDWMKYPDEAWGFRKGNAWMFDGTWETLFGRIRGDLSSLVDFRLTFGRYCSRVFDTPDFTDKLSPRRYGMLSAFPTHDMDEDLHALDFVCDVDAAGNMEFGNNLPNYSYSDDSELEEYEFNSDLPRLNRAEDTEQGDLRAFKQLLKAVKERSLRMRGSRFGSQA